MPGDVPRTNKMATSPLRESCGDTIEDLFKLEIVFTIAAPAFDILFIECVLNTKIGYTTAEKLTFEAFC